MGAHTVITHALSKGDHVGTFCPDVRTGCAHTMVQDGDGVGVACAEWADAHGIEWRQSPAPARGVSLGKASDSALTTWERELVHRADAGLSFDLSALPAHAEGLRMNDPITLSSALSIVTGGW